jgi:hypothetical protein
MLEAELNMEITFLQIVGNGLLLSSSGILKLAEQGRGGKEQAKEEKQGVRLVSVLWH